jgi:hypothetical protein
MSYHQHKPAGFLDSDVNMMANRVQARHAMLVDLFRHVIADSTVMLLGAEDGRWCYSFAAAGALQVVGVEESKDLVSRFLRLPDIGLRERIEMREADPLTALAADAKAGRSYDVVVLFDVIDRLGNLHALMRALKAVRPRLVVIDGLFAVTDDAVFVMEHHRGPVADSHINPRLIPSRGALAKAAQDTAFEVDWVDWARIPEANRTGLSDYFQSGPQRRQSLTLMPT